MKCVLLFVLVVFLGFDGNCQGTPFSLENLYNGQGVIFSSDYKFPIVTEEGSKFFTPSTEDITKAETLLLSNSDSVKYVGLIGMYEPSKLKKKLCRYNRQYAGYQNTTSDRVILINLLNFKNKKKANINFPNWRSSFITGFGDFYEKNKVTFLVNLTSNKVSLF